METKIPEELKSKKWRTMVLGIGGTIAAQSQDLPETTVFTIGLVFVAYIVAQGLSDYGKGKFQLALKQVELGAKLAQKVIADETEAPKTRGRRPRVPKED